MPSKKILTANGIGGIITLLVGVFLVWWTFHVELPSGSALIPRLASLTMILGAVIIIVKDVAGASSTTMQGTKDEALTAIVILISMCLYGYLMLRLGVASSTVLFLLAWWFGLRLRMGKYAPKWTKPILFILLGTGVGACFYLLFIVFLGAYIPNTWLF